MRSLRNSWLPVADSCLNDQNEGEERMGHVAAYDEIADWYEHQFLGDQSDSDPLGINRALRLLLGSGSGVCLEIGCGTGVHARQVRELVPVRIPHLRDTVEMLVCFPEISVIYRA